MEISIKNLLPGLKLSNSIILDDDTIYMAKDTVLTMQDIESLKLKDIKTVPIYVSDKYNTFSHSFNLFVNDIIKNYKFEDYKILANLYKEIIDKSDILLYDMGLYLNKENHLHLVNSLNIAVIITLKYNLITENSKNIPIDKIALASLLQDIGRNLKDEHILENIKNKYDILIDKLKSDYPNISDDIFIKYDSKYHPVYSYLLANNYDVSDDILKSLLYHHEKESGDNSLLNHPLSLEEESMSVNLARILKLADIFDLLVSENVNENTDNPFVGLSQKIDKMVSMGFVNARLTNILKSIIPLYQAGMKVLLSNGTLAYVEKTDSNNYNNPILVDEDDNELEFKDEDVYIVKHYYD